MRYITILHSSPNASSVRELVEQLKDNQDFKDELLDDSLEVGGIISLLLSAKASLPADVKESFHKDSGKFCKFISLCMEADFIPGNEAIEDLFESVKKGLVPTTFLISFIEHFKSIKIPLETVIDFLNNGMPDVSGHIILNQKIFHNEKIILPFLLSDLNSISFPLMKEILSLGVVNLQDFFSNKDLASSVNSWSSEMVNKVMEFLLEKNDITLMTASIENLFKSESKIITSMLSDIALGVLFENYDEIFKITMNRRYNSRDIYYRRNMSLPATYDPRIESLPYNEQILILGAPQNSKYFVDSLLLSPKDFSEDDIVKALSLNPAEAVQKNLLSEAIRKGSVSILENYGIKSLRNIFTPTDIVSFLKHNSDDEKMNALIAYFYKYGDAALRKQMNSRSLVPEDTVVAVNQNKRSYFDEIFNALLRSSSNEFFKFISILEKYDFDKFLYDARYLTTKRKMLEDNYFSEDILSFLTKSQYLGLLKTGFRFRRGAQFKPNFKFVKGDDYSLIHNNSLMLLLSEDIIDCLNSLENSDQFANVLRTIVNNDDRTTEFSNDSFENIIGKIFSNKAIVSKTLASNDVWHLSSLDEGLISTISSFLTRDEIIKSFKIVSSEKDSANQNSILYQRNLDWILGLKDVRGDFVLDDSMLESTVNSISINSISYIRILFKRSKKLVETLSSAYLKGGAKELNKVFGTDRFTGFRRNQEVTEFLKSANEEISKGEDFVSKAVRDVFENKGGSISEFKLCLVDPFRAIQDHHEGRTVVLNYDDVFTFKDELTKLHNVKLAIPSITMSEAMSLVENHSLLASRFKVERITVCSYDYGEPEEYDQNIRALKLALQFFAIDSLALDRQRERYHYRGNAVVNVILSMMKYGVKISNLNTVDDEMLTSYIDYIISGADLSLFEEHLGLIYTPEKIMLILEKHASNESIIDHILTRIPDLSDFYIEEIEMEKIESENLALAAKLKKAGLSTLSDSGIKLFQIKQKLLREGENFSPIDISQLNNKEKSIIIIFIESDIDERYKSLKMTSRVLADLKDLYNYSSMSKLFDISDSNLTSIFSLDNSFKSNKNLMAALKDLVRLSPEVTQKIMRMKLDVVDISYALEWVQKDFLVVKDSKYIELSSELLKLKPIVVEALANGLKNHRVASRLLKGTNKNELLAFLRSSSKHDAEFIRDMCQMIISADDILSGYEDRIVTLTSENESPDDADAEANIDAIKASYESLRHRLDEITKLDDPEAIHNRLVTILAAAKNDPLQILGQNKYKKLEQPALTEHIDCSLYFPKTRGDLMYIGKINGWCVSYHSSYGDNVIRKGNILVGLCPAGEKPHKDNVVALAHFIKKDTFDYYLEQLKGPNNRDDRSKYNHQKILATIVQHLREEEERGQR